MFDSRQSDPARRDPGHSGRLSAMDLRNARILLTGGSRGIGEGIAEELTRRGARLALVARDAALLGRVADRLGGVALPTDLADPAAVDGLVARAEEALGGPLDALVNNAGIDQTGMLRQATPDDVRRIHQVNLLTPIELCRQALPGMLARDRGHLVNVSSMAGVCAFAGMTLYASTKAGLTNFTGVLRQELRRTGIDLTVVELGPIPTDMLASVDAHPSVERSFTRMRRLQMLPEVPVTRVARSVADAMERGRASVRLPRRAAAYPVLRGLPQQMVDLLLRDIHVQA